MTKTLENLFYWLVSVSDILLIFYFLLLYHKRHHKFRLIWILLLYTFISLATNILYKLSSLKTGYLLYSCFTFIEYALFTYFIFSFLKKETFRKLTFVLSIIFTLFLLWFHMVTVPTPIDSIPIGVETVLLLVFSFCYFYEQMNDVENGYIYNRYHFWVVTGMILYLTGSVFLYIFYDYLDAKAVRPYWFITDIFNVMKNVLFSIALSLYNKKSGYRQDS